MVTELQASGRISQRSVSKPGYPMCEGKEPLLTARECDFLPLTWLSQRGAIGSLYSLSLLTPKCRKTARYWAFVELTLLTVGNRARRKWPRNVSYATTEPPERMRTKLNNEHPGCFLWPPLRIWVPFARKLEKSTLLIA